MLLSSIHFKFCFYHWFNIRKKELTNTTTKKVMNRHGDYAKQWIFKTVIRPEMRMMCLLAARLPRPSCPFRSENQHQIHQVLAWRPLVLCDLRDQKLEESLEATTNNLTLANMLNFQYIISHLSANSIQKSRNNWTGPSFIVTQGLQTNRPTLATVKLFAQNKLGTIRWQGVILDNITKWFYLTLGIIWVIQAHATHAGY